MLSTATIHGSAYSFTESGIQGIPTAFSGVVYAGQEPETYLRDKKELPVEPCPSWEALGTN